MKMFEYPERISISPTFRQKREDDFYLVDRKAFPGKGTEYVRADRIEELEAENADLKAKLAKATRAMSEALGAHDQTEAEWIIKDALAELTGDSDD